MTFTTVTANIQRKATKAQLAAYFRPGGPFLKPSRVAAPTSLATFQEGAHLVDDAQKALGDWWEFMSVFAPQPFAIDTRVWDVLDMDGVLVYPDTYVGKAGAGPATLTERHVQWVKLRHKESPKAILHLLNVHAPPSKQVPKQPKADYSRDELHEMLMDANAAKINKIHSSVILQGDCNANWKHPNMDSLRNTGLKVAGKQTDIDLILYRGGIPTNNRWQLEKVRNGQTAKVVDTDVHNPLWAEFDFVRTC